jgi:hypothetical protein
MDGRFFFQYSPFCSSSQNVSGRERWYPGEGRSFLERGLAWKQAASAPLRLRALITEGLLMWYQRDFRELAPVVEEALALARELEDRENLIYALALPTGCATSCPFL